MDAAPSRCPLYLVKIVFMAGGWVFSEGRQTLKSNHSVNSPSRRPHSE